MLRRAGAALALPRRLAARRMATTADSNSNTSSRAPVVAGGSGVFSDDLQPAIRRRRVRLVPAVRLRGRGGGDVGRRGGGGRRCLPRRRRGGGGAGAGEDAVVDRRWRGAVAAAARLGAQGGAADGAGGVLPEPGVDAGRVEGVAAGR